MKRNAVYSLLGLTFGSMCAATALAQNPDRTRLPIHELPLCAPNILKIYDEDTAST